jgi:hypothetical protein
VRLRWPGMRYTKTALMVFGLGLVLGFVVVVIGGYPRLERVASAVMALGLVALPLALFADGRGLALLRRIVTLVARPAPKKAPARRRTPAVRRKPSGKPPTRPRSAARAPRRKRR